MKKKTKRKIKKGGMFSCFSCKKKTRREKRKGEEEKRRMEIEWKQEEMKRKMEIEKNAEINVSIIRNDTRDESKIQINPYKNIYETISDYNLNQLFRKLFAAYATKCAHKLENKITSIISSITLGDIEISKGSTWKELNIEDEETLNVTLTPKFLECEEEMIRRKNLEEKARIEREKIEKKLMEQESKRILSLPENEQHIIKMDKKLTNLIEKCDYAKNENKLAKKGSPSLIVAGDRVLRSKKRYNDYLGQLNKHIKDFKEIENEMNILYWSIGIL